MLFHVGAKVNRPAESNVLRKLITPDAVGKTKRAGIPYGEVFRPGLQRISSNRGELAWEGLGATRRRPGSSAAHFTTRWRASSLALRVVLNSVRSLSRRVRKSRSVACNVLASALAASSAVLVRSQFSLALGPVLLGVLQGFLD